MRSEYADGGAPGSGVCMFLLQLSCPPSCLLPSLLAPLPCVEKRLGAKPLPLAGGWLIP